MYHSDFGAPPGGGEREQDRSTPPNSGAVRQYLGLPIDNAPASVRMRSVGARRRTSPAIRRVLRPGTAGGVTERDPWAGEDDDWAPEDRAAGELDEADEEDPLAPARAVLVGFLLVIPLWLAIAATAYGVYRALF
jgi:hypothetical protein